jgi:hypothetical protein
MIPGIPPFPEAMPSAGLARWPLAPAVSGRATGAGA